MNLKIMLSERGQAEKSTHSRLPFKYNSKKCKIIHSNRKDICGCMERDRVGEYVHIQVTSKPSGVIEMFVILILVMIS